MTRTFSILAVLAFLTAGCTQTSQSNHVPVPLEESSPQVTMDAARKVLGGDAIVDVKVTELPGGLVQISGNTNLPMNTVLMLSIEERIQGGFSGQSKSSVSFDGSFSSEAFGPAEGLKDGLYLAEVVMPIPSVQPDDVKRIIGENGENLSGPLVENGTLGITLSAKKEFNIGGANAGQSQKQSEGGAQESVEKLKLDLCVQLEQLLTFKDQEDFKTYGFGLAGPYHKWLKDVEALRDSQPQDPTNSVPLALRAAPGELIMLGMEYMQKGGETDYTQQILPELKQTINYADYLAGKSSSLNDP